jgi:hypothetical protein
MWWPFRRARPPEETGLGQQQPADVAGAGSPHKPPPAWPHARALQRTIADDAPTSRLPDFRGHLAAHRDHRLTGSLGHYLAPDAPSGRLDGVATASTGWTRDEPDWHLPRLATAPVAPTGITIQRDSVERPALDIPLDVDATQHVVGPEPRTATSLTPPTDVAAAGLPPSGQPPLALPGQPSVGPGAPAPAVQRIASPSPVGRVGVTDSMPGKANAAPEVVEPQDVTVSRSVGSEPGPSPPPSPPGLPTAFAAAPTPSHQAVDAPTASLAPGTAPHVQRLGQQPGVQHDVAPPSAEAPAPNPAPAPASSTGTGPARSTESVTVARVADDGAAPPADGASQASGGELRPILAEPHVPGPGPDSQRPSGVVPRVDTSAAGSTPPTPTLQRAPLAEPGTPPATSVAETTGPRPWAMALPAVGEPSLVDPPSGDVTRPTLGTTPALDQLPGGDAATAATPVRSDAATAGRATAQRLPVHASPDAPALRHDVPRTASPTTPVEPRSDRPLGPVAVTGVVTGAQQPPAQPEVQRLLQVPTTGTPAAWVPTHVPAPDGTPHPPDMPTRPAPEGQPRPVEVQAPIVQRQPHRRPSRSPLPVPHDSPSAIRAVPLQRMFDDHAPPAADESPSVPTRIDYPTPQAGTWHTAAESSHQGGPRAQVMTWTPAVQRQVTTQEREPTATASQTPEAPPAQSVGADETASADVSTSAPGDIGTKQPAIGDDPAALEELARRLYDPLCALLRAELWLDRERAGLVTERRG